MRVNFTCTGRRGGLESGPFRRRAGVGRKSRGGGESGDAFSSSGSALQIVVSVL
jgi:hypothetical protein